MISITEMDQNSLYYNSGWRSSFHLFDIRHAHRVLAHGHIEDELIVLYVREAPTSKCFHLYEPEGFNTKRAMNS